MEPMKPGDRVGVILSSSAKEKRIELLGYGILEGRFKPEGRIQELLLGATNPRLKLDSGRTVWGFECWWGPEESVKAQVEKARAEGWTVVDVDIEDARTGKA